MEQRQTAGFLASSVYVPRIGTVSTAFYQTSLR